LVLDLGDECTGHEAVYIGQDRMLGRIRGDGGDGRQVILLITALSGSDWLAGGQEYQPIAGLVVGAVRIEWVGWACEQQRCIQVGTTYGVHTM
jgi:hypothetical protein